MKKKTAVIFIGFFMTLEALSGCGGNDATEAASESAQTEDEGTGEDEEMQEAREEEQEQKEKEEKKAEKEAEKASKEDKKETEKKSEAEDSENKKEAQEETETESVKIAVLLPDQEEWSDDAQALEADLAEDGYEPLLAYAEGDASRQVSQIQEMLEQQVAAFIITPVDAYGLTDVLAEVKEAEIPVFSYDDLIMDTNAVKYYTTFGGRQAGQMIAEEIIKKENLKEVQEEKETRTIEFLMGSPDDTEALFLYNGVMEGLQPYLDDGTLVCTSGKISFDDTGIIRWSRELAGTRMSQLLEDSYEDGAVPDIICTGFDDAALGAEETLETAGIVPGSEQWPLITGVGCKEEAVRSVASGKIGFSLFMDYRDLADNCEQMVHVYLTGEEDPEVNDYEQYDNGVKIIGTYLCEPQVIDGDNYELLIDNGYYEEEEIAPEAEETVTPVPEESVTPSPKEDEATPQESAASDWEEDKEAVKQSSGEKEDSDLKKEKESDKDEKKASEKVTLKKSKSASDDK